MLKIRDDVDLKELAKNIIWFIVRIIEHLMKMTITVKLYNCQMKQYT